MSLYPVLWAVDHAPVRTPEERAILVALVVKGDFDGMNCFRSYKTLAEKACVDPKTVGRRCRDMESRGLIQRQETHRSRAYLAIPEEQRPVCWEAMIPAVWWSEAQLADINEQRAGLGRPPITPENRPMLAPAPPKKARADKGVERPERRGRTGDQAKGQSGDPGTTSPGGDPRTDSSHPPDWQSPPPGLVVPLPSESPSESPSENKRAVVDAVGQGAGGFERAGSDAGAGGEDGPADGGSAASGTPNLPRQRHTSPRPRTTKTRPRAESDAFAIVRAAIPAAVAAPGTRLYAGLHRAINDLLNGAPGIPRRSPEQVVARINRRWYGEQADARSAPDYRGCDRCTPSGCDAPRRSVSTPDGCDRIRNRNSWLAEAIIAQDCPDPGCENGQIIGGGPCVACRERHARRRQADQDAAQAAAGAAAAWEAQTAAQSAARAVLDAWTAERDAEERRLRAVLQQTGVYGELLEHRVDQHITGWCRKHPRPTRQAVTS